MGRAILVEGEEPVFLEDWQMRIYTQLWTEPKGVPLLIPDEVAADYNNLESGKKWAGLAVSGFLFGQYNKPPEQRVNKRILDALWQAVWI
ncbi:MAG: hypothetical protein Q7S31_00915 [bacterium]|nr:hypothetical protein [bacterium]